MNIFQQIRGRMKLVTPRLLFKKPLFFIRTANRLLFKSDKIRSILFHSSYVCNFNCEHCYEKNLTRTNKKLLSLIEQTKVIKECLKLGALSFDFVSGESILNPNLLQLIKACEPNKTYITLTTNGWKYTEEKIKNLMKLGVDKINLSLDSIYPNEHDKIRRMKGAYNEVMNTMKICDKVGMGYHITIFVYHGVTKTGGFNKLIDWALNKNIRIALKIAIPLGNFEGNYEGLITKGDREKIEELCKSHSNIKVCDLGNKGKGCPAFNEILTITAYGDVLPCNGIHISFGNLREEKLSDIIEKGRKIKYFDGDHRGCLAGENKEFIQNCLSKTYGVTPYPIKSEKVFK